MDPLILTEWVPHPNVALSPAQRDDLGRLFAVDVTPSAGSVDHYDLCPTNTVGAATLGDLPVIIQPRFGISSAMFLISYALDPGEWWDIAAEQAVGTDLVAAVIPAFCRLTGTALRRGLLAGYSRCDELSTVVRGRIQFTEQLRRYFGRTPPIAVAYDRYDEDILENRLLKAAAITLQPRATRAADRQALQRIRTLLEPVTDQVFPASAIPAVTWTRLNAHYRHAVELARLILLWRVPLSGGAAPHSAFRINMATVFERFLREALRQALRLRPDQFPSGDTCPAFFLDDEHKIRLRPDLSIWRSGVCSFVGDAKYRHYGGPSDAQDDLYQLLAYVVGCGLTSGLLIYASGDHAEEHTITELGRTLQVVTLDLTGTPNTMLAQVERLATRIGANGSTRPPSHHS